MNFDGTGLFFGASLQVGVVTLRSLRGKVVIPVAGALSNAMLRPSVSLSVPCSLLKTMHFRAMVTIEH